MAERLHGDKYGVPFAGLNEIESTSYLDGEDLGFINVLYGRYTSAISHCFIYLLHPICF